MVAMVTTAFGQTPIQSADFNAGAYYYRIYNKATDKGDAGWMAFAPQDDSSYARLRAYDAQDESQVWQFIPEGDGYYIYNVLSERYLNGVTGNNNASGWQCCVKTSARKENAAVYSIEKSYDGQRVAFCWGDKAKANYLWNDGSGYLCGWMDDATQNHMFYLEVAGEIEIEEVLPPSAEEIAARVALAEQALAKEGVGYPAEAPRATLQAAIDALEAEGSTANYDALETAINAYYAATDVVLPKAGKLYSLTMVAKNGNKFYLNYTGSDIAMVARTSDELPESAKYLCGEGENGAVTLQTTDGKYLVYHSKYAGVNWLQNGGNTAGLQESKDDMANITFAKIVNGTNVAAANNEELFGLLSWYGLRGIKTDGVTKEYGYMVLKADGTDYDGASAPFYNANFSSAFMLEEFEASTVEPEPEEPEVSGPVVITSADQLSNAKCYTIANKDAGRGNFYAVDGKVDMCAVTYNQAQTCHSVAYNAEDPNQQFAFVKYEDKFYLYNVAKKMFVVKNGDVNKLSNEKPYDYIVVNKEDNGYFSLSINGTNYITASPGWCANASRATCLQTTLTSKTPNDGWDDGAWYTITEVADFNADEALAMLAPTVEPEPEEPKGDIDVTKEYYLEAEYMAGMSAAKGYITIDGMQNQVYIASEKKQAFKFELVENGTDIYYTLSTAVENMTGSTTLYLNCNGADVKGNATNASQLFFEKENATSDKYYIKSGNAYLRASNDVEWVGTNQAYIVRNEECDPYFRIKFTLVADGDEPTPEGPEVTAEPLVLVSEPASVEKISKIELEFDREVASVDANARFKLLRRDESIASQFGGSEAQVSGNKVTFWLMSPISESGTFTFIIPAEAVVATDGGKVAETSYKITVVAAPKPSKTSYNVDNTFSSLTIAFSEEIEFVAGHTVEKLEVKAGNDVVAEIPVAKIAIDAKNLTLTLDKAIAPEGTTEYTIAIPANFITKKGSTTLQYAGGTIKVTVKIPFALKGITPVSGSTVEAFENIVIEYNAKVNFYPSALNFKLVNTADNNEIALTATKDGKVVTLTTDAEVPNGTYTLAGLNNIVDNSTYLAPTTLPEYTITVAGAEEVTPLTATFETEVWGYEYEEDGSVTAADGFGSFKLVFNELVARPFESNNVKDLALEWVKDGEGNVVAISRVSVNASGSYNMEVELSSRVEAPGVYTLTIPADIVKSVDGTKAYEGGSFVITIPGSETPALPEYQLYVLDANMEPSALEGPVASVQNFVFTFNGAAIQLAEAPTAGIFNPATSSYVAEGTVVVDTQMFGQPILGVMFSEPFATSGTYMLHIPENTFMVGDQIYPEVIVQFTIAGSETPETPDVPVVALAIESVTPAEGEVESISEIIITFNAEVGAPSWDDLTMYDAKYMPYVFYYQADETLAKNQVKFVIETPITAAGEYILPCDGLYIKDANGKETQGFADTFTWTVVEADTAIDAVEAEAENAEIYDLTGRRVKEITKGGIYIINGKKTMVK